MLKVSITFEYYCCLDASSIASKYVSPDDDDSDIDAVVQDITMDKNKVGSLPLKNFWSLRILKDDRTCNALPLKTKCAFNILSG